MKFVQQIGIRAQPGEVVLDEAQREPAIGDDVVPVLHQIELGHRLDRRQILLARRRGIQGAQPLAVPRGPLLRDPQQVAQAVRALATDALGRPLQALDDPGHDGHQPGDVAAPDVLVGGHDGALVVAGQTPDPQSSIGWSRLLLTPQGPPSTVRRARMIRTLWHEVSGLRGHVGWPELIGLPPLGSGAEWNPGGEWQFFGKPRPVRCPFLWGFAVVNNDDGVSPCCGTFYSEDDMDRVSAEVGRSGATTFRDVWNGERFQAARGFYRRRDGSPQARAHVCHDCPNTVPHEQWREHRAAGGDARSFQVGFTMNDVVNYFWNRRPGRRQPAGEARRAAP